MTIHTGSIALPDLLTLLANAWREGAQAATKAAGNDAYAWDTITNPYDSTTWPA